jgi:hypothetical protein
MPFSFHAEFKAGQGYMSMIPLTMGQKRRAVVRNELGVVIQYSQFVPAGWHCVESEMLRDSGARRLLPALQLLGLNNENKSVQKEVSKTVTGPGCTSTSS